MAKRLVKFIGIIPVLVITFIPEMIYYSFKWLFTGKEFPESTIIYKFIFEW